METIIRMKGLPLLADLSITAILSLIVLTLCFKYIVDLFRKNPRLKKFARTLPGPPALPLLGNSLDFGDGSMMILQEYEKKYGSMYRLWLGKHLVVATSDLDFIEAIFHSSKVLDKPPFVLDSIVPFTTSIVVFTAHTPLWKRSRKELQTFFRKNILSRKLFDINQLVRKRANELEKHVAGAQFDVGSYMERFAFEAIVEVLLNTTLENSEKDSKAIGKCFREANAVFSDQMFKPWLSNAILDVIFYNRVKRNFKKYTTSFIKKIFNEQAKSTEDPTTDQITFVRLLHQVQNNLGLEEHYAQNESINMLAAGYLTTSSTASFTILMLAMHPDIQEKLYEEIIEKLGYDDDRDPDIDDLNSLPYLDQVLKETERRFLLIPSIFRYIYEDMHYGSHKIPAGTAVLIAAKAIHMNPQYYKNPEDFDPEHFSAEAVSERPRLAFFPFSGGARGCIGKALAEIELKSIIINFVRRYKFSSIAKMADLKMNFGFSASLDDYMVSVQRR